MPYDRRDYFRERFSKVEIADLLRRIGARPRDVLSVRSSAYKRLGLAERDLTDDELFDLLVAEPTLLRRPLVVAGNRFALGYNAAMITELAVDDASQ